MLEFKCSNNQLYALSEADIANGGLALLPSGCVEITREEADAIRLAAGVQQIATADMVRAEGARRLALIGEPYSKEERETWPQQVEEAKAVSADANAEAPLLARLAAPRGITVAQMAAAVIAKANAFASAAGDILAAQSALLAMDPIPADFAADARWVAE